jgi:hypothetical protein
MAIDPGTPRYDMAITDVDAASRIMLDCLEDALKKMNVKSLDKFAALAGAMQMCMRLYADHIDDDEDAIRQIRKFLDDWERDYLEAAPAGTH